ncbi:tetratricopeptide repeat protein [Novosphingobium ginsenosidimutans]|uniref:Uncharacterized protein n=1 Tax=Novosphingobium ginsenosidimutans TaxID=1176536 RepID=A0A5B8S5B0_9SPHN|nr:hypothetical protein [Novosphingobium ginsenosidimutans]QEA15605.1 hypothetical protein FRF71_05340 [Novosphingobium ginsenosidimutans]
MRLTASKALFATLGCVLLGGCSIFAPKHMAQSVHVIDQEQLAKASQARAKMSEVTDAGRALLDAGQPGYAIDTFRKALAKGEAPGPALNGLGVAYARIGRQDLAVWYFKQAMVFDPGETRYAMNLERVSAPTSFATALAAQAEAAPIAGGPVGRPATSRPVYVVTRSPRAEIKIVTAPAQSNVSARPTRMAVGQSLARIEFADHTNTERKSRVVEVTPTRSRITQVGSPPARKPAPTVRMASANPQPLKVGRTK